jgi:Mrp family chromosome partitioning ATPase
MRLSSVPQRAAATRLTRIPPEPANAETCRLANLVVSKPNSAFAESIHALHFALRQMAARQINVLLIASALPGKGKSTVAANLERTSSMYGERVLLIDADLRRPSLATKLGLPPSPGFVAAPHGIHVIDASDGITEQQQLFRDLVGEHLQGYQP